MAVLSFLALTHRTHHCLARFSHAFRMSASGLFSRAAFAALFVCGVTATPISSAADTQAMAVELLGKMAHTMRTVDYRGVFTYEVIGSRALQTLQIEHKVQQGVQFERIYRLNGPEQEIIRQGLQSNCVLPGASLLQGLSNVTRLHDYYRLAVVGFDRVAGREALIVQVFPRDDYRYGYTLALDKTNGFLLKSILLASSERALERIQFVDISFGEEAFAKPLKTTTAAPLVANHTLSKCHGDAAMVKSVSQDATDVSSIDVANAANASDSNLLDEPEVSAGEAAVSGETVAASSETPANTPDDRSAETDSTAVSDNDERMDEPVADPFLWQLGWHPKGFVQSGHRRTAPGVEMLMYTDGLATFSVFVEALPSSVSIEGDAQRGATVAHMTNLSVAEQLYQVTVVGEITLLAAKQIAAMVKADGAGNTGLSPPSSVVEKGA